jgi:WD40 repeat protein
MTKPFRLHIVITYLVLLIPTVNSALSVAIERNYSQLQTDILSFCKAVTFKETSTVQDIAWSSDGKYLANTTPDSVHIRELSTEKITTQFEDKDLRVLRSIAWNPDNTLLAVSGNGVMVWDIPKQQSANLFKDKIILADVGTVAWSPDSNKLVFNEYTDGINRFKIWDKATGQEKSIGLPTTRENTSALWNPKGETLAIADGDRLQIWDVNSGNILIDFRDFIDIWAIAWKSDGKILAGANASNSIGRSDIQLWDVTTENLNSQLIGTLEGHLEGVIAVSWKPNSDILASGSRDKTIRLWDTSNNKLVSTLTEHNAPVNTIEWSPDGTMLASADDNGTIIIWKVGACQS